MYEIFTLATSRVPEYVLSSDERFIYLFSIFLHSNMFS
jgi:hypothetical protein